MDGEKIACNLWEVTRLELLKNAKRVALHVLVINNKKTEEL